MQLDVELARRWRIFNSCRVVAVNRIVIIRVYTFQELLRVFFIKTFQHAFEALFTGIGGGGENIAAFDLALHIEGCAATGVKVFVKLAGAHVFHMVLQIIAQGEIGKAHVEPFGFRNVYVAAEVEAFAILVDSDGNTMTARRENALHDKAAIAINGHRFARNADAVIRRNIFAIDGDGTARDVDVANGGAVFGIARSRCGFAIVMGGKIG